MGCPTILVDNQTFHKLSFTMSDFPIYTKFPFSDLFENLENKLFGVHTLN